MDVRIEKGGKPRPKLRVGFVLARRFTLCAFATFIDVLRLAADEGDRSRPILCEWVVLSDTMNPITSSCGVKIQPSARMSDPTAFDYVVVVGGLIDEIPNVSSLALRFLQSAAAAHVPLVGVCTGAFILHRAGLMNGFRCCVSWFHHADFLEQFDGLTPVSDQIFVIDRDRLTCSGGVSSAHLAAHLVEKHVGLSPARKSLQIMMIDEVLGAEKAQPGIPVDLGTKDEEVRKALLQMRQNLDDPLTIEAIADRLGLSRRSLERRFQTRLNRSPATCYLSMRLDQADLLLKTTNQSIATVAAATGFSDSSHLVRAFKDYRGMTPGTARKRGRSDAAI